MNAEHVTDATVPRKPLRLWPGIVAGALLILFKLIVPLLGKGSPPFALLGAAAGGALILLWWLFLSRARWIERLGGVLLIAAGMLAASPFLHRSIAEAGNGLLFPILALPFVMLALLAWAVATRRLSGRARPASMAAALFLACGAWTLLRTEGVTGAGESQLRWRWTKTHEEKLLAQGEREEPAPVAPASPLLSPSTAPTPAPEASAAATEPPKAEGSAAPAAAPSPAALAREPEWPGFRGPRRDSVVHGARIVTDWSATPPVEMWRRPVGPGWSSFAVDGDLFYTQEQRGDEEIVSCHRVSSGKVVWRHSDRARFWESNGGAGPRATPTLHDGRVYTLGATGILNALDARTGAALWTRNAPGDTKVKNPGWGFAGSPLVVGDRLVVATSGTLAAYDLASGAPRWIGPKRSGDYSSPHLATIGGTRQVVLLTGAGATSVAPADGKVLWEHALTKGSRIIQPAITPEGDVLVTNGEYGEGNGIRRVSVTRNGDGWNSSERWSTTALKPNFNDFVVHEGYAYGFDGSIMACVDLQNGERKWKGGRYGNGQVLLLADQDVLLVLSEDGELALVQAAPEQFTELARFKAIEGKTWNHPVLVREVLLVRNGEEMAAFRLAPAER